MIRLTFSIQIVQKNASSYFAVGLEVIKKLEVKLESWKYAEKSLSTLIVDLKGMVSLFDSFF